MTKRGTPEDSLKAGGQTLASLLAEHGELMDGRALQALLKYPSDRAFRRAVAAHALPIQAFKLPGRRGWFARTRHVSHWLDQLAALPLKAPSEKGGTSA